MAVSKYTRAEQETILRWDEESQTLDIYTASPRVALKLQRRGYPLQPMSPPDHGWRAREVPLSALTFRRLGPDCSGRPKRAAPEGGFFVQRAAAARETGDEVPADSPKGDPAASLPVERGFSPSPADESGG